MTFPKGRGIQRYKGNKQERQRQANRKHRYGLDYLPIEEMNKEQGGLCAVCRKPFIQRNEPQMDHDHNTMEIRGLLCFQCNRGIGGLQDNPALCRVAAEYLERKERGFGYVKRNRR